MTLKEIIQATIKKLHFNLTSLEGDAQREAIVTMRELIALLVLLETGAPVGQIREQMRALEVRR